MYFLQIFSILLLLCISSGTRSLESTCDQFEEKIISCEPYACITADNKHPGHVVNWNIMGKENGLCSWSFKQMVNEEKQTYHFTKCLATSNDQTALSTRFTELNQNIAALQDIFSESCTEFEHKAHIHEERKEITSLDFLE